LRDVEVEPSYGEVGVLDLLRHCCLLFEAGRRAIYFFSFIGREIRETKWMHINVQSVCRLKNEKKANQSPACLLCLGLVVWVLPQVRYGAWNMVFSEDEHKH
jgi:hypothetical protein